MISNKIRALLSMTGHYMVDLLPLLPVKTRQALSFKFKRNAFTLAEVITICDYLGYTLAVVDENNKIVMSFDKSDIEG